MDTKTPKLAVPGRGGVSQVTLDLFSSEGAPAPEEPAERVACVTPSGDAQRYRLPLWRRFMKPA